MAYISALVIQHNNDVFVNGGIDPGEIQLIPTPESGGYVFSDYWAVPVAGEGIVTSFNYDVCAPGATVKPDPQAFHVVRINSTQSRDSWYVNGTSDNYRGASRDAECCESPAYDMPTTISDVAPCQALCANSDGYGYGVFGLPSPIGGGEQLTATGWYHVTATGVNTQLPSISAATAGALATALDGDATWATVGDWTASGDGLTLEVVQDALLADLQAPNIVCVLVQLTDV